MELETIKNKITSLESSVKEKQNEINRLGVENAFRRIDAQSIYSNSDLVNLL